MRLSRLLVVSVSLVASALIAPSAAHATLIMEPVFNRVAGTGGDATTIGFFFPELINPATGLPFLTADQPGEVVTYPAGYPPDPVLVDTVRFFNNTEYHINGFALSFVGTAVEPEPFNFTVARDPNVDAVWGDVDGDGIVGHSDIFGTVTLSADRRTIFFSNGLIPVGTRFTDFNLAMTTTGEPFLAAVDASWTGVPAPEPGTLLMTIVGLGLARAVRRSRAHSLTNRPRGVRD